MRRRTGRDRSVPSTGIPLLNPNLANDFTNRGGVEFGATTTTTAFTAQAVADSSPSIAAGGLGVAGAVLTTSQEYLIEIDSRDIIASSAAVDSVAAKAAGASRVSTQVPNDKKIYKVLLRFKNVSVPATNTNVIVQRVLVIDNYEQRVQVSSGEGDTIAAKATAVNVTNTPTVTIGAGSAVIGSINQTANATANGATKSKTIATASTNATSVKASAGKLIAGAIVNTTAATIYFKLYNKASAPTVGTDVPVESYPIPAGGALYLTQAYDQWGSSFTTGIAFAITGAAADNDATNIGAGPIVNLQYV